MWEFKHVGFFRREKNWSTREKTLGQGRNQKQTQPKHGTGPDWNSGHIVGRRGLSPLHRPCAR